MVDFSNNSLYELNFKLNNDFNLTLKWNMFIDPQNGHKRVIRVRYTLFNSLGVRQSLKILNIGDKVDFKEIVVDNEILNELGYSLNNDDIENFITKYFGKWVDNDFVDMINDGDYYIVSKHNVKTAVVLMVTNSKNELLLLDRSFKPFGYCLPGGMVKPTIETKHDALIREVYEETGIVITEDDIIYDSDHISETGIFVTVYKCLKQFDDVILSDEHLRYKFTKDPYSLTLAGNTLNFIKTYIEPNENN